MLPAVPCIGSTRIAARRAGARVLDHLVARTRRTPRRTTGTGARAGSDSNRRRVRGTSRAATVRARPWCRSPISDSVPALLPWKPPQNDRNSYFSVADLARRMRRLDRLGAARVELDLVETRGRVLGDLRQRHGPPHGGERADGDLVDLLLQDPAVARMPVPERVDADAGGEVEEAVAVDVLDQRALARARPRCR